MRSFFALCILSAIFAAVAAATVNDCKKDVSDIGTHVRYLDKAIEDLPRDISLSQGQSIEIGVINLQRALVKASVDFKATSSFLAADSQTILRLVESYSPNFLHLLANLVAKKESIVKMPIPDIAEHVRHALVELHRRNDEFDDAWISVSTNDVRAQARTVKARTGIAFAKADAAFSP